MAAKITGATVVFIALVAVVICSSGVSSYGKVLEDECKEVVETGIGKCFAYIMGKEYPAPSGCCSQVSDVMSKNIACLCVSIKGAFDDDQTGGVSFYNALQLGNSCKIDGLDPTNCIGILDLKPGNPLYGNITNPPVPAASSNGGFRYRNSHAGAILCAAAFGILLSLF